MIGFYGLSLFLNYGINGGEIIISNNKTTLSMKTVINSPDFLFCFTVDTEPDDLWRNHTSVEFKHVERLLDFHNGLVKAGGRPTYFTTSEFVENDHGCRTMRQILEQGTAELGAHFHSWTRTWPFFIPDLGSPPLHACAHQLGQKIEEQMLDYTCRSLKKHCDVRPCSFRGGRWSLNGRSLISLRNNGINIDSTITPGISWKTAKNRLESGTDYRFCTRYPHYLKGESLNPNDEGDILEIPVGTAFTTSKKTLFSNDYFYQFFTKCLQKCGVSAGTIWLRPTIFSQQQMRYCLQDLKKNNVPVWVAMIHSSEIIPCRYFKSEIAVNRFWKRCFSLIEDAIEMGALPVTLSEAADFCCNLFLSQKNKIKK
jgi:hypothetical protein